MKRPNIIVVGSSNTDTTVRVPRLPLAGETVLGGDLLTGPGGKGANQAVAAARAGARVTLLACVGRDISGDKAIAGYVVDGIDVSRIARDRDHASGAALVFVARDGENCIAVAAGANLCLSPAHVRAASSALSRADVVLIQLEIQLATVKAAVRLSGARGTRVILNPAPGRPLPDALLRQVSVITPNESEAELLTGIRLNGLKAAERAARKLLRRGVAAVVLTLGAEGSVVASGDDTEFVPAFKVKAVDTTGAGDVFNGVLAVGLAERQSLTEAVRLASAAAALSVTRPGAQSSAPTRKAIDAFLLENSR